MADSLEALPEDWERGLAVVAHPDDMEYGAASAVARWTGQAKRISYVLVTDGEAGIDSLPPDQASAIRREEQIASCAAVGVTDVEFLGHPDGLLVAGLELRADLAGMIRRYRPEVVLSINFRNSWGGPSWNHVDHRVVGEALLDSVRDASNRWLFRDRGDPWSGVRMVAFNGSPQSTHGVDVTDSIDSGVASLECHRTYLDNLDSSMDTGEFLRSSARATGPRLGVELAVGFEVVTP